MAAPRPDEVRAYIRDYIEHNCIARVPQGSKELVAYDRQSFYSWQFYLRSALYEPSILRAITDDFFEKFPADLLNMVQIAGVDSAATPLLASFALRADALGLKTSVFSIRKEQKKYGLRNWIEGSPSDKPVVLVDDLTSSSHNTITHAVKTLEDHGLTPAPVVYAVVYKTEKPQDQFTIGKTTFTVVHLFSLQDFHLKLEDYERAYPSMKRT